MKKEQVEIYSDATNRAVMKHPGRNYPGSLIQGDTLYKLCRNSDRVCELIEPKSSEVYKEMNELRNTLWDRLNHYKHVLEEHNIDLPFSEK